MINEATPQEVSPQAAPPTTKVATIDVSLKAIEAIKNSDIVTELNLPPVKIHCSVLAEDAIKSAIADYRKKQSDRRATK